MGAEFALLHANLEITEQRQQFEKPRLAGQSKYDKQLNKNEGESEQTAREEAVERQDGSYFCAHPKKWILKLIRACRGKQPAERWNPNGKRSKHLRERQIKRNGSSRRGNANGKNNLKFTTLFSTVNCRRTGKKISALPRIWHENLGFVEAFKLLGVELTSDAANLAKELHEKGLKPKGVFKFVEKLRGRLEKACYADAATRGLSTIAKPKRGSGTQGTFDLTSALLTVEFDYAAVEVLLDGAEVPDVEVGISAQRSKADLETLQSWRSHFSTPADPNFRPTSAKWADKPREIVQSSTATHRIALAFNEVTDEKSIFEIKTPPFRDALLS